MWLTNGKQASKLFIPEVKALISGRSIPVLSTTRRLSQPVRPVSDDSPPSANYKFKQSYCHGSSEKPLLGATIGQLFDQTVEKFPDREAYVFCEDGQRATFSQFKLEVDALAEGLVSRRLTKGDRLGIWAPNIREWIITQLAAAQTGLILVGLNTAYQGTEAEYVLKKAGCKALVIVDEFRTQNYYNTMTKMIPELSEAKPGELQSERLPELKDVFVVSKSKQLCRGTTSFEELMSSGGEEAKQQTMNLKRTLQFDEPACLQFTSGTTGRPKGVTLTHHSLVNNAVLIGQIMNYSEPTRMCSPFPLFHIAGVLATSLVSVAWGVPVVYPSPGYNSTAILKAIHNEKCDCILGTPPMFIDMLAHPDLKKYDLSTLRKAGLWFDRSLLACYSYAIGRTSGNKSVDRRKGVPAHRGKDCRHEPSQGIEEKIKIVDHEGNIVPVNTPGEICIRGYGVMIGYWGEKEQTESALEPTGWLHSGDLGTMDEHGYFRIVGRLKDLISRGGQSVYPAEVEYFLHTHPKIQDVQVISVPDERLGEEVCAWIKLRQGETMTAGNVKDFCTGQIAYFKIPRYIKFVDDYPMTASGKVMKYVIRQQAASEYKSYFNLK
ncbi:acyl-CoA synthetase family member 2, mitochondrial-like isoform X2 [Orbicella faveolata]|uniref:acyl-CoA synthetase family member 2, mitochondrial-like isoform X2 n=1 Tax=Orbicella faveolata TaxID=48498 RepID=UPI0009E4E34C|nr:acyl-CoA synthetase family member 2, mitochondrial-like isoform X2 [Orbicella faveolata]